MLTPQSPQSPQSSQSIVYKPIVIKYKRLFVIIHLHRI